MPLDHEKRPNSGIYHEYMIFNLTMVTDGKLTFVRMTTKSRSDVKIDAFTQFNIKLVLLNGF